MKLWYNPELKENAKALRCKSTFSEVLFWKQVRNKKLGYDFHRQKPIDYYIVDFYCPKLKLIIEIDGDSHNFNLEYHRTREKKLKSLGLHIIRFNDRDVKQYLEGCIERLKMWIEEHKALWYKTLYTLRHKMLQFYKAL